jgi:hypothetical protein
MKRHQPALLGGLLIGLLSALPVVGGCCCLWAMVGGTLTAYLIQQRMTDPITTGDAAVGGLIAGLVGAVLATLATWLAFMVIGPVAQSSVEQALASNPAITPEMHDFIMKLLSGKGVVLLKLCINLPVYAVFGMLGGLLGMAFFKKKPTPPVAQG